MGREIGRRTMLAGLAAAGGTAALPRGGRAADATPRNGGKLRAALAFVPAAIDPITGRNSPDFNVVYAICDALVDFDPNTLELMPGLARSWTFTDPKTLVLDLQEGVLFHDGTPFDADAVKFNLERSKSDPRSLVKSDVAAIDAIEVAGKYKAILHLNRPAASLPAILAERAGCMVSPTSVKNAKDGNIDRNPVGTGAWKFESWEGDYQISVVRNERYWKPGLPHLDRIDYTVITDLATSLRSVVAGENDLAFNLQIYLKPIADAADNIRTAVSKTSTYQGAFINFAKPPFDDVRIRQALNYAVDRQEYDKVVNLGFGEPLSAVLPRELWACDPATADYYTHDIDKARKLLADAGHPDGIDIDTIGWPDQTSVRRNELVAAQVAKAGFRLNVRPISAAESNRVFMIEKSGALLLSPTGGRPDPGQFYAQLFSKDGFFNAGSISLPGFDELLAATDAATDQAARKAAFATLQKFELENAMTLVLSYQPGFAAFAPNVHGYVGGLLNRPKLHSIWMSA